MIHLSRRDLLAGAATVGAATVATHSQLRHAGRSAASWRTGPRFLSLQGRSYECHLDQNDGARCFRCRYVRNQMSRRTTRWPRLKPPICQGHGDRAVQTLSLFNTGSKLVLIDCGNGIAALEPTKGAGRPDAAKSRRRRYRPQEHRRRSLMSHCIRSHQRHSCAGRLDGVPERRNHGAGEKDWDF